MKTERKRNRTRGGEIPPYFFRRKILETYRKVKHKTKSDRLGDFLVALAELHRNKSIPDDARIESIYAGFGTPRTLEITVEWKEIDTEDQTTKD